MNLPYDYICCDCTGCVDLPFVESVTNDLLKKACGFCGRKDRPLDVIDLSLRMDTSGSIISTFDPPIWATALISDDSPQEQAWWVSTRDAARTALVAAVHHSQNPTSPVRKLPPGHDLCRDKVLAIRNTAGDLWVSRPGAELQPKETKKPSLSPKAEREAGYYHVCLNGNWEVAYWWGTPYRPAEHQRWTLAIDENGYCDEDFTEIDETQITRGGKREWWRNLKD